MKKKIAAASVVVFAVFILMDYLVHSVLLRGLYVETASLWRATEALEGLMWVFWVVDAAIAFFTAWLFAKGWEAGKPWLGQGVRFGLVLGLIFSLPMGFSMYAMLPIPLSLGLGWFAGALATFVAASIAAARVFRT